MRDFPGWVTLVFNGTTAGKYFACVCVLLGSTRPEVVTAGRIACLWETLMRWHKCKPPLLDWIFLIATGKGKWHHSIVLFTVISGGQLSFSGYICLFRLLRKSDLHTCILLPSRWGPEPHTAGGSQCISLITCQLLLANVVLGAYTFITGDGPEKINRRCKTWTRSLLGSSSSVLGNSLRFCPYEFAVQWTPQSSEVLFL